MMGPDAPEDRPGGRGRPGDAPRRNLIELEPVTSEEIPRYVMEGGGGDAVGHRGPSAPIPEQPPHTCPSCDYNLTGLTSRRCPECGEPFTLAEARRRGIETSPEWPRWYRAAWVERYGTVIGLVLMAAAFVVPNAVEGGFASWPPVSLTWRGWLMLLLLTGLLGVACIARVRMDVVWPRALLVAGVVAMLMGLAVSVL